MKTIKRRKSILFYALMLMLHGCFRPNNSALQMSERRVEGLKVFERGELYAEILLIGRHPENDKAFRGLAIYFPKPRKYEWISPKSGWQIKMDDKIISEIPVVKELWESEWSPAKHVLKGYQPVNPDTFAKLERRTDPHISPDGMSLIFFEEGLFGPKRITYSIR